MPVFRFIKRNLILLKENFIFMNVTELKGCCASIKLTSYSSELYEPAEDTFALADALIQDHEDIKAMHPSMVLEIGSGSGYVICSCMRLLHKLGVAPAMALAVDLNPHACNATAATLRQHGLAGGGPSPWNVLYADATSPDLLARLEGKLDLVLFNPPYVPTPGEEVHLPGIARAWAGGDRGREVIDVVLPNVARWLRPGGRLYMVTVHENDPQGLIAEARALGLAGSLALRRVADEEVLSILRFDKVGSGSG